MNEPASPPECGRDLPGAGHSRDRHLQVAQSPAALGGGGTSLPEGPGGWAPADKLTVVLETAGFNATEIGAYSREQGLFSKQLLFYLIEFSRLQVCTFSNLADICF